MGKIGQLKKVQEQLMKDLKDSAIPLKDLGEKYGVTRQAVSLFAIKRGIKRPKKEHTENCSICQRLLGMSKKPQSDFLSSQTIHEQLELGRAAIRYHIRILREKGLVSRNFGRLRSKNVEMAYQIYFKERLPVIAIGRQVGIKNFCSVIKKHRDSGWNVPVSLLKH
jgi:biotin operon repressor